MPLPTAKTPPQLTATTAKVLLYGEPKIGKSTLAAGIDPEHTLFLPTEPGLGHLEVYKKDVTSWDDFKAAAVELRDETHTYTTVVIDTLDNLHKMCTDATMKELGITHPSDLEWGKGWSAVTDKFALGVSFISSLGLGIWFIDHAKDEEIKKRVGTVTKSMPATGGGAGKFVRQFCDYIFYAQMDTDELGVRTRLLRTAPSENWIAGVRSPEGAPDFPDPLALDADAVREAMANNRAVAAQVA